MSKPAAVIDGEVEDPKAGIGKAALAKRKTEVTVDQPASESAAIIQMIERAARDPSVDIDKMERLFQMSERVHARSAEAAFNAAMSAAQAELVPVVKNQKNKQTGTDYANLAAISEAAMPIIYRHGFGVITSEFESKKPDHLGVVCEVTHSGGHSKRYEFNVPWDGAGLKGNANKTPTHAYASTLSYGERYAKCKVFGIATKDDDGNAAGKAANTKPVERITEKQVEDLNARIQKTKAPAATIQIIFQHLQIEGLDELTSDQFDKISKQLKEKHGV